MSPAILGILAGITGVMGALSVVSYFYFLLLTRQIKTSETSLREMVEGAGLFKADQVLEILRSFDEDETRLAALRTLVKHEKQNSESADALYRKIKGNIDLAKIRTTDSVHHQRMSLLAAAGFAVIAGVFFLLFLRTEPKLSISHLRMFDDSYREGPAGKRTLTKLSPKPKYYEITSPDEFLLGLGFVISGYARSANGGVDLQIKLIGEGPYRSAVWETSETFSRTDDWKRMRVPQHLGAASILSEFGVTEDSTIPVVAVLQCAEAEELSRWSGVINIQVTDNIGGLSVKNALPIQLKKPATLVAGNTCR